MWAVGQVLAATLAVLLGFPLAIMLYVKYISWLVDRFSL
jgi:hypothetical protein